MGLPAKRFEPETGPQLFDPDVELEQQYDRWYVKTGDPVAASILATGRNGPEPGKWESRDVMTPPQVGRKLGVDPATVIGWIRSGELKASNIGKGGKRPRYRIQQSDLQSFLKSRQPQPRATRKRRATQPGGDIEFFN